LLSAGLGTSSPESLYPDALHIVLLQIYFNLEMAIRRPSILVVDKCPN